MNTPKELPVIFGTGPVGTTFADELLAKGKQLQPDIPFLFLTIARPAAPGELSPGQRQRLAQGLTPTRQWAFRAVPAHDPLSCSHCQRPPDFQ